MTDEQAEMIARAIGRIASGESTPDGLEGVAIALAGHGLRDSVAGSIRELASAVHELADAIREVRS